MIDPRFYDSVGPISLGEIARIVGAALPEGFASSTMLTTCGPLFEVGSDGLAFLQGTSSADHSKVQAGACLVGLSNAAALPSHVAPLIVSSPRAAFAIVAAMLVRRKELSRLDDVVSPDATIEAGVLIGHHVVVGSGAEIGSGTTIGPNCVIGPGVTIGRNCAIGANTTIYCAHIGDRVTISSNSVIGEAGFGVEITAQGPLDVPQLGRVILQDDVSIGSLCAVDRGAFGDTVMGIGCKIDNFTQIAHNCQLGRGVIIAAFGGISGSCIIGDKVMMGGRVGIADHTKVGDNATISAAAGVFKDVPTGENWGGVPAQPIKQWHREVIALKKLAKKKPSTLS
jgi:UDP-3-O-[3-hydroxymyristoyl] glucosamine N-acyltransferase